MNISKKAFLLGVAVFFVNYAHCSDDIDSFVNAAGTNKHRLLKEMLEKNPTLLNGRRAYNGENALMAAIGSGSIEAFRFLMQHGVNLINNDRDGNTALMYAATAQPDSVAEMFTRIILSHTEVLPYINYQNHSGETALIKAAEEGRLDVVTLLVNAGADVTLPDDHSETPVQYARSHQDIIDYLCKHGANDKDLCPKKSSWRDIFRKIY